MFRSLKKSQEIILWYAVFLIQRSGVCGSKVLQSMFLDWVGCTTSSDHKKETLLRCWNKETDKQTFTNKPKQSIFRFQEKRWLRCWVQPITRGRISPPRLTSTRFPTPGSSSFMKHGRLKCYWNANFVCRMKELVTSVEQILPQIEVSSIWLLFSFFILCKKIEHNCCYAWGFGSLWAGLGDFSKTVTMKMIKVGLNYLPWKHW